MSDGVKPIALVVSDIDGTLVDRQKKLTAATTAAVSRLEEAGVGFTVISARPISGILPIVETLGLDGPMAAFNGGILFKRDGTITEHHVIDEGVAMGVMAIAAESPVDLWVFADDHWYASTDQGEHVAHERLASIRIRSSPTISAICWPAPTRSPSSATMRRCSATSRTAARRRMARMRRSCRARSITST